MSIDESFVEKLASSFDVAREEVQTCVNKTSVTVEDIMHFEQIVVDDLNTVDFDNSALKAGCLFACIAKKKEVMTDARMNADKIKEIMRAKSKENTPDKLAAGFHILDTCTDRVKGKTNECEVTLKFIICVGHEMRNYYIGNNDNE